MSCPTYLETVTGALPSEWKVLVWVIQRMFGIEE
jgi:hypothetical protein